MIPEHIHYKIIGHDYDLPKMFRVRQRFDAQRIDDVQTAVFRELDSLSLPDLRAKRVALTAGSRGVANQAKILKATADWLKSRQAQPFIVPAMGSHAGAEAAAQKEFIAGYGITEEAMETPIISSMEVVALGETAGGFTVYCDKAAAGADYILPVHRVKAHTAFRGEIESGPCKMMVIGLGKHKGASQIHSRGFPVFHQIIPEAARVFVESGKVLAAIGIVENAYEETMRIEALPAPEIIEREKTLLGIAKNTMARLMMDKVDVLVIERIGKDISGGGMDPNVTGRPASGAKDFQTSCPVGSIAVLGLTGQTHGNTSGMGMADVVTQEFLRGVDFGATYTNCFTARISAAIRLPVVANHDRDAVRLGMLFTIGVDPEKVKLAQIQDTLNLSEIMLSEAYLEQVAEDSRFEILSDPQPMRFDGNNRLARLFPSS